MPRGMNAPRGRRKVANRPPTVGSTIERSQQPFQTLDCAPGLTARHDTFHPFIADSAAMTE